jgi:hypothetical protein
MQNNNQSASSTTISADQNELHFPPPSTASQNITKNIIKSLKNELHHLNSTAQNPDHYD